MSEKALIVSDLHKKYELGTINSGTFSDDLKRFVSKLTGKEDPTRIIGTKHEKEYWALNGVSFEINQGDSVGIIGKNGAGKSTLLKILSRVTTPTKGTVKVNGRIASLLEVGTGFHPDLTGKENIFMNGAVLGMSRGEIKKNLDEIIDFSGVEKYINTPVKRYSSGMYVRLAFAVAAHLEPEILIVDEVLAVGDLEFQKKCLGKMNQVSETGRTVLFVSHNMPSIQKLCKTGIMLKKGKITHIGEINGVVNAYLNDHVTGTSVFYFKPPENHKETPAYVLQLSIEDHEGNLRNEVLVGSPWQLRLRFQVNTPIENFVPAIGIVTAGEVPVRTCWSVPMDIKPGIYEAIFKEDSIILATGLYQIAIGLSSNQRNIQYIEGEASITISEARASMDEQIVKSNHALILNPMNITIKNIG